MHEQFQVKLQTSTLHHQPKSRAQKACHMLPEYEIDNFLICFFV
jgi:hypothetical protein